MCPTSNFLFKNLTMTEAAQNTSQFCFVTQLDSPARPKWFSLSHLFFLFGAMAVLYFQSLKKFYDIQTQRRKNTVRIKVSNHFQLMQRVNKERAETVTLPTTDG
jgi:hypothetical protein